MKRVLRRVAPLLATALLLQQMGCSSSSSSKDKDEAGSKVQGETAMDSARASVKSFAPNLRSEKIEVLGIGADGFPKIRRIPEKLDNGETRWRVECDFNGDGRVDYIQWYRENGDWIEQEAADLDGDGHMDVINHYKKTLAQKEPELVLQEFDTRYEGKIDLWKYYQNGKLARREYDRKGLGKADYWEHYENGRLIRIERDENSDGSPDSQPQFKQAVQPTGPEPGKKSIPASSAR